MMPERDTHPAIRVIVAVLAIDGLFGALFAAGGCASQRSDTETGTVSGQINGQPVTLQWTRDSEGTTTTIVPPLMQTAAGLLPSPWGDLLTIGTTLLAGGGLASARAHKRRADRAEAGEDETYTDLKKLFPQKGDA